MKNTKGFTIVEGLLLLVIIGVIGGTGWYVWNVRNKTQSSLNNPAPTSATQKIAQSKSNSADYQGWKSYQSKDEGFVLRYPSSWSIDPETNGPSPDVEEIVDFKAPDGLIVRYAGLGQDSTDIVSCGRQSTCLSQQILSIDKINPSNHPTIDLVKTAPDESNNCYSLYLDQPSSIGTTPKVGENSYSDHYIQYSMPRKNGGVLIVEVTDSRAGVQSFDCGNLSQSQFFAKPSVQEAEKILRSISY